METYSEFLDTQFCNLFCSSRLRTHLGSKQIPLFQMHYQMRFNSTIYSTILQCSPILTLQLKQPIICFLKIPFHLFPCIMPLYFLFLLLWTSPPFLLQWILPILQKNKNKPFLVKMGCPRSSITCTSRWNCVGSILSVYFHDTYVGYISYRILRNSPWAYKSPLTLAN